MVFEFGYAEDMLNIQQCMASLLLFEFLKYVLVISPFTPSFYKMLVDVNVFHHELHLVQEHIYSKNLCHHHIFLARRHNGNYDMNNNLLVYNIEGAFYTT
jgi:hypothetical protein